MNIDASFAMPPVAGAGAGLQAGYGVSFTDLGHFEQALQGAGARLDARPVAPPSEALQALAGPLEHVNREAVTLSEQARIAESAGAALTPGEMVMLTVRCQEFMFHCQLTSNVANRASDGLQQLFRQQS